MFNHPFFQALCGALLAAAVGYLINQLPAIKQFPGKNILVVKLTIEAIILVGIYSLWNTAEEKSHELQVLLVTVGGIALVFLIWHTFKLIWMLRKTKTDNNSTDNTTTELKSPDDWRRELLKVMKIEVETRLNDSLYDHQIIRIATEDRNKEIGRTSVNASTINKQPSLKDKLLQPLRILEVFRGGKTQLEPGKPIIKVFEESDIAGRLLILGNPGAGKTTLLLELARDLITRAQNNSNYPIPVLFELTNWRDDKQIISNWLQADLKFRYNIPEKVTREWLSTEKLVPLLDGLDELGLTRQKKCIDKINEFLQSNSSLLQLVVCCREEEYQQGEAILNNLRGAVCLQPLSEQQIKSYLRELKCQHLWQGIKNDADGLGELAKTPLFLNLIPVAYPDGLVSKSKRFNSEDERKEYQDKCRQKLFDKYIERKLEEHHDRKGYKAEDIKRWLIWLAKKMNEHNLKEFYIEDMQPSYLENRVQRLTYLLIYGSTIGLIYGLMWILVGLIGLGFITGLIYLLFYGFNFFITYQFYTLSIDLIISYFVDLILDFIRKLKLELLTILLLGVFYAFFGTIYYIVEEIFSKNKNIYFFKKISFKFRLSFKNGIIGIIAGLVIGIGLAIQKNRSILMYVSFYGTLFGILGVLLSGVRYRANDDRLKTYNIPNQTVIKSLHNNIIFSIFIMLCCMLFAAIFAAIVGESQPIERILASSIYWTWIATASLSVVPIIKHFSVHIVFWKSRSIPWNYTRFLKYADERKLINQVGGRFTFIHDKLQEHFAGM